MQYLLCAVLIPFLLATAEETCPDGKICPEGKSCCSVRSGRYKCCEPALQGDVKPLKEQFHNSSSPKGVMEGSAFCESFCSSKCCNDDTCCPGTCCSTGGCCLGVGSNCCTKGCCARGESCCNTVCCLPGSFCCKYFNSQCCPYGYQCCSGGCCKDSQICGPPGFCYSGVSALSSTVSSLLFLAMLSLTAWRFLH